MKETNYYQIFGGVIIGVLFAFFISNESPIGYFNSSRAITLGISEQHQGTGKLTNPIIDCVNPEDQGAIDELNISKFQLTDFVNKITSSGKVGFMSVYIRDLNNGPWIGVNEQETFIGGSLLKVPLLMSYMKLADADPSVLNKKILYRTQIADNTQYFTPLKQIEVGKTYTVSELLTYMIDYSDNNAAELLSAGLDTKVFNETFQALGMGDPNVNEPYPVNTTTYSAFFRVLFNASYLSESSSEKTLELLTQSDFNQGITALLPKNIIVAHKFGIRTQDNVNQLHDCGIVYYPKHPYLLCIMSRGGSFDDLASGIAQTSKFVYDQVSTSVNN